MRRAEVIYNDVISNCMQKLGGFTQQIERISIYIKHINALKRFSCETWTSRQDAIVAIEAAGVTGYAECIAGVNRADYSLALWQQNLEMLKGKSAAEAFHILRCMQGSWEEQFIEMLEMALLDLCGKLEKCSALQLLGYNRLYEINGVHVILSDDVAAVSSSAQWARAQGKSRLIKVKLFGDTELDCSIIQTVRKFCPAEDTYLIGDVNCGYGKKSDTLRLEDIRIRLQKLQAAGLNACEDPARLEVDEWIELQDSLPMLALIPDYPLRKARESIHIIRSGMGKIYNIHPDSAGSLLDALALAAYIKELGAEVMIGDDSLLGPATSMWQQVAAALGACWVEATEKKEESAFYFRALKTAATDSSCNPISIRPADGFGIQLDEAILKDEADLWKELRM